MDRKTFIFTIGYQGNAAIVNGRSLKKHGGLDFDALIDKGLYKPAFCAAFFDGDTEKQELILSDYNNVNETNYASIADLKRLFGVHEVPDNIDKVIKID